MTPYLDEKQMVKITGGGFLPALDRLGEFWHLSPGFMAGARDPAPDVTTTRHFLTHQSIVWSTENGTEKDSTDWRR